MATEQLPLYMLDIKGEVPNLYLNALGASVYIITGYRDFVERYDAFIRLLRRLQDKTGIKFNEEMFSDDLFRTVFANVFAKFFNEYNSARERYLIKKGVQVEYVPVYTAFDDIQILLAFSADSPYENLDEILKKNAEILKIVCANLPAWIYNRLKNVTPKDTEELSDRSRREESEPEGKKQDKNNQE